MTVITGHYYSSLILTKEEHDIHNLLVFDVKEHDLITNNILLMFV